MPHCFVHERCPKIDELDWMCSHLLLLFLWYYDANKRFDAIDKWLSTLAFNGIDGCCHNGSHHFPQKMKRMTNWAKFTYSALTSYLELRKFIALFCITIIIIIFVVVAVVTVSTECKKRRNWRNRCRARTRWQSIDKQNSENEWFTWQPYQHKKKHPTINVVAISHRLVYYSQFTCSFVHALLLVYTVWFGSVGAVQFTHSLFGPNALPTPFSISSKHTHTRTHDQSLGIAQ